MQTISRIVLFLLLFSVILPSGLGFRNPGKKNDTFNFDSIRDQVNSITPGESRFHVNVLASDEFGGRGTGTPGQWLAAKYIANEFATYGLEPISLNNKFYQDFKVIWQNATAIDITLNRGGQQIPFASGDDFTPFSFTGDADIAAPVVFAGYGITAPEYHYDDYAGIDVRGKIVLVLRHEPREKTAISLFKGEVLTAHSHFENKARNAREHGAVALLLVTDPGNHHGSLEPQGHLQFNRGPGRRIWKLYQEEDFAGFPAAWIGIEMAEQILGMTREGLAKIQTQVDETLDPASFEVAGTTARISLDLERDKRETQNVVALLRGRHPRLRDQVIVIGAHYDHLGTINGLVHNGADDNASGTAGLLEIAEAFSQLRIPTKRSILFIAFSAEELGLLGSKYYVEHPLIPLHNTVAMINLDMISRNSPDNVSVIGSSRSPLLHEMNLTANREVGMTLKYDGEIYFNRSDQANFAEHNIPVIFYNTAVHADYHRATDDADKINPEKLSRVARLAFLVAWQLAVADATPVMTNSR